MQHDSFDKFSMTRLRLLIRREILMLTFWGYSMIFIMPFLFTSYMLWLESDIKRVSGDGFSPFFILYIFPAIIYVSLLGNLYSGIWQGGHKILPNPFPRGILPVRITEKFIADFFCFAILIPLAILILLLIPFLIFSIGFSIWLNSAVVFFAICSPLVAFKFLRIAIVEDTSLRRYHDAVPFLEETIEWIVLTIFIMAPIFGLIFYGDILPWHYLAMGATIITIILWWATYRIRLKNAKR